MPFKSVQVPATDKRISVSAGLGDNAMFKLAELYESKLGQKEKAEELYYQILTDYPGSVLAVESRKRYRRLSSDGKTTNNIE